MKHLIIIDMQNDFVTGSLGTDGTNLLQTVFLDGKITKETNVNEIRNILNGGAF